MHGARGRSTLLPFAFTLLRYEDAEATCRTGLAAAKRSPFSEKRSPFFHETAYLINETSCLITIPAPLARDAAPRPYLILCVKAM